MVLFPEKKVREDERMTIHYPYLPRDRTILYLPADDPYMRLARDAARWYSLDKIQKVGAIIHKDRKIIGYGANGSNYHETHGCERKHLGSRTGEDYHLCPGCDPRNHAEAKAIACARESGHDTTNASMYLWGHWWACKPCWDEIIRARIANIYLLEGSERLFDRDHPDNIIGRQFT
jgi:deoxycytidylate deaminase